MPLQFPARWLLLSLVLLSLPACRKPDAVSAVDRTVTLDSEPLGCGIFLDGTQVGTTPCTLNESQLHELGLNWPDYVHAGDSLRMNWALDTTGIAIQQGEDGKSWRKLFFKLPADYATQFATTETPWGRMALALDLKRGGSDDNHLSFQLECMPPQTGDGMALKLTMPQGEVKPGGACRLTLVCRNQSANPFAGFRPELEVFCSRFDDPATLHSMSKVALPESWRFFKSGEQSGVNASFTAPAREGDFCVFAVVTFHDLPSGESGYQPACSNGMLLHVKQ